MIEKTFNMPEELTEKLSEKAEEDYTSEAAVVRKAVKKEVMQ